MEDHAPRVTDNQLVIKHFIHLLEVVQTGPVSHDVVDNIPFEL